MRELGQIPDLGLELEELELEELELEELELELELGREVGWELAGEELVKLRLAVALDEELALALAFVYLPLELVEG